MGEVLPLPHRGEVFLDPRGEGRSLRVSGHRGAATVVLSIWRQGECRATFRLSGGEVDEFVRAGADGILTYFARDAARALRDR